MTATPDPTAVIAALRAVDATADRLGIDVLESGAGTVTISLVVGSDDANALGMGHGGMLFTFADTAMQYSSNSHGIDAVATSAAIDFVRAVRVGDRLIARGHESSRSGKSAVCDVEITDEAGDIVALFRGRTLQIGKR